MSNNNEALFQAFLNQHDTEAWNRIVLRLLPSVHEVDQNALLIWFRFFPLELIRALQNSADPEDVARELVLQGRPRLEDHIDSSHRFLYGSRFWPAVKSELEHHVGSDRAAATISLERQIRQVAAELAGRLTVDSTLTLAITAIAFMTLQQVGLDAFRAEGSTTPSVADRPKMSPDKIVARRAADDGQGLFGFLRGEARRYTVTFDERDEEGTFALINTQELTTAAALDRREYHSRDPRCTPEEGPIPVQCRSASCGTCWVGILAGAHKLSPVGPLESRRIKTFGYIDTDEPNPLIRLACQAQAHGNITIVIPPWNGVIGKLMQQDDEVVGSRSG